VIIGNYCSIGPDVRIINGGIHPPDWVSTFPIRDFVGVDIPYDGLPTSNGDIIIGHDVWIGTNVTILSGVTIGNGAIIAAGSVVTKSIDPYAIAGGIPAKKIRSRFTDDQIAQLQKIKWWNWTDDEVRKNIHLLSSPNIDQFISTYRID
jgi:acetyltransferase-like isoleucine patch superfamily enzyme